MRQIRLLPIVIVAGAALLLLKGFGIMSGGGYVLTGPTQVRAAGSTGNATLAMPVEPTMVDENPTMDDGAPTLPMGSSAGTNAEPGDDLTGSPEEIAVAEAGESAPEEADAAELIPSIDAADQTELAMEGVTASRCPEGDESVVFSSQDGECLPRGDAVPMIRDDGGNPVPLEPEGAVAGSEDDVLRRLAERREELDAREAELDMRLALVEAAEKRITERTAALEMLETRINAMVDEKRVLEEAQFTALVAMYETMKPKDAAAIFDQLEPDVLLRVARAINPRKMGPIMAKMNPVRAKDLTAGLAVDQVEPTIDLSGEDLSSLPQIVGQ